MAGVRYNVVVMTSSNHVRKQDAIFTRQPVRPGTIRDSLDEVAMQQYEHIGFGLRTYPKGTTKYPVSGIRLHGAGVDGTDIIMMYCKTTKACVVVKAERAK